MQLTRRSLFYGLFTAPLVAALAKEVLTGKRGVDLWIGGDYIGLNTISRFPPRMTASEVIKGHHHMVAKTNTLNQTFIEDALSSMAKGLARSMDKRFRDETGR